MFDALFAQNTTNTEIKEKQKKIFWRNYSTFGSTAINVLKIEVGNSNRNTSQHNITVL